MAGYLFFRYAVVVVALAGVGGALGFRSSRAGVALAAVLGIVIWVFTVAPLEQPYALQPGTDVALDYGLVSAAAARGEVSSSWVVGRASPRPAWGGLFHVLAPGNPVRARTILWFFPIVLFVSFPIAVYWFSRRMGLDEWVSASAAFAASLAASIPLDADAPFSLFHRGVFFTTPSRGLAIVLAVTLLGFAWSASRRRWRLASAAALGGLVFVDPTVSAWALLALFLAVIVGRIRARERNERSWPVLALAVAVFASRWALLTTEPLSRVPTAAEVIAIESSLRDLGFVTLDMRWVFVFCVLGVYLLWRQARLDDLRILSMLAAAYVAWLSGAIAFHLRPFSEVEALFHLMRFNVALVAGIGAAEGLRALVERGLQSNVGNGTRLRRSAERAGAGALSFVCVVILLLPESAAFVWRPTMFDPLYYPSTYEWDPSVRRLETWLLDHTDPDGIVLTGDDTGEWVSALSGRRVASGERVLGREDAQQLRRQLRQLFLSNEPPAMAAALKTLGADVLVLDPSLREVYWQLDESILESSALFEKAHQIGDRYSIYVVR